MYSLYVPFCAIIINIILSIISMNKIDNIKNYNRYYLAVFIESFIMTILCTISIYLGYINYDLNIIRIINVIEYLMLFNYFTNLMMYISNICESKELHNSYYIINLIGILIILITEIKSVSITYISTFICSFIVLFITFIVLLVNKNKLKEKIIPIVTLLIEVLIIISGILKIDFISIEFLSTIIVFVLYSTLENPSLKLIEELNIAKENADKSNQYKTDFLSSMSHEIRTPLNAIVGFNECILEAKTLEDAKESSKDVITAVNTLLEIVNGILDISKIESGKLELINVKYRPRVLFDEIIRLLNPRILEKGLKLNVQISEDLPYRLRGDQANLKKCIINLLTNAVKYTDSGSITFNVSCINKDNISNIAISVEDTGKGIKKEDLDKIFSKFERVEEDRNSKIEGTGLGLAITKQIIELMGGKIVVQSIYGKGSKFTIYVSQEIVNMAQSLESMNKVVIEDESLYFKGKKVLIVDDNSLNLKVASKILSKYEVDIDNASSGKECIEKIKNIEYDLILMDEMMPNMSGTETLHVLKENKDFDIPVIVLTANALVGERESYIKKGFSEYLSKPIVREDLERLLKHFLANNKKKPINFDDTETLILDFTSIKN